MESYFLLLHSGEDKISTEAFLERANKYFSHSTINAFLIFVTACLIGLLLYKYDSDPTHIYLWLGLFLIPCSLMVILKINNTKNKTYIKKILLARVLTGLTISILFGCSIYILPESNNDSAMLLLISIYIAISLVIALHQISFPDFYLLFKAGLASTVIAYWITHWGENEIYYLSSLIIGIAIATPRYIILSNTVINDINIKIQFKHEKEQYKKLQEEVRRISQIDELTDISNRRHLKEITNSLINKQDKKLLFGIIFIDLNEFKLINDTYGHETGDFILKCVANLLAKNTHLNDNVGRLGGDEFCIICRNVRNKKELEKIALHIKQILKQTFSLNEHSIKNSGSVGIAIYPQDGKTFDQLLSVSDKRMYADKHKTQSNNTTTTFL